MTVGVALVAHWHRKVMRYLPALASPQPYVSHMVSLYRHCTTV